MALSAENKHKILFFLCYSGKTLIEDSTHYNSVIASRLDNLNEYVETQVTDLITAIESIRTKLASSPSKSNVRRIGDIELDTDKSSSLIHGEYKRLRSELASLLDVTDRCRGRNTIGICGP